MLLCALGADPEPPNDPVRFTRNIEARLRGATSVGSGLDSSGADGR